MAEYTVPPLPYDYAALEPHITAKTMQFHHDKHHQAYVDNLNKAVEGTDLDGIAIEELVQQLDRLPEDRRTAARNNGGGHVNHSMFWQLMKPGGGGDPSGALGKAIESTFRDVATLRDQVNDAGVKRFGSGWTWLVVRNDSLEVMSTPNQDSPLMDGATPILGIDVWEHAYYLNYQNRRPDYLAAWWDVIDWDEVARRYEEARG